MKQEAKDAGIALADLRRVATDDATAAEEGAAAAATTELVKRLHSKLPPDIAALPGSSAALEDFLAKLRLSASTVELGEGGGTALAVELTDFLGLDSDQGYKAQAILRPPTVSGELVKQLSADDAGKAAKELGDFDDVLVTLAFTPTTLRLGRELAPHEELVNGAMRAMTSAEYERREAEREALLKDPRVPDDFDGTFASLPDDLAKELRAASELAERAKFAAVGDTLAVLDAHGFFLLADLAANQPQLVFNASRSIRDELVGAEETTGKLSYEMGWVNLNGLRRACRDDVDLACLSRFLTPDRRAALAQANKGNRLTFSVDYSQRQDARPTFAGRQVTIAGRDRVTGSVALGRNLAWLADGTVTRRFDLTGSWESWSDDKAHQDRGVVKVNFTQRINADFAATVGAVWASKPELLGDVDEKLSARVGLTYSFDSVREATN